MNKEYEAYKSAIQSLLKGETAKGNELKGETDAKILELPILLSSPLFNLMKQRLQSSELIIKMQDDLIKKAEECLGIEEKSEKREFVVDRFAGKDANKSEDEKEEIPEKPKAEMKEIKREVREEEKEAWCIKCKKKTKMKDCKVFEGLPTKKGKTRHLLKGTCEICGKLNIRNLKKN